MQISRQDMLVPVLHTRLHAFLAKVIYDISWERICDLWGVRVSLIEDQRVFR